MTDIRLIDANLVYEKILFRYNVSVITSRKEAYARCLDIVQNATTVDAQPVKQGHWSECYRDCRCISVICSVCKNATVISHGCLFADEVPMNYVIEKLPHCPKCCSDMRGDADGTP